MCGSSTSTSSACSTDARLLSRPHAHFNQLQSLAMSGLSALALGYPTHPKVHTKGHLTSAKSCPGAVHLLPLLEHHISLFCQTLETMDSSVKSPLRGISLSSSSVSPLSSNIEETLLSQEDIALASVPRCRLSASSPCPRPARKGHHFLSPCCTVLIGLHLSWIKCRYSTTAYRPAYLNTCEGEAVCVRWVSVCV